MDTDRLTTKYRPRQDAVPDGTIAAEEAGEKEELGTEKSPEVWQEIDVDSGLEGYTRHSCLVPESAIRKIRSSRQAMTKRWKKVMRMTWSITLITRNKERKEKCWCLSFIGTRWPTMNGHMRCHSRRNVPPRRHLVSMCRIVRHDRTNFNFSEPRSRVSLTTHGKLKFTYRLVSSIRAHSTDTGNDVKIELVARCRD